MTKRDCGLKRIFSLFVCRNLFLKVLSIMIASSSLHATTAFRVASRFVFLRVSVSDDRSPFSHQFRTKTIASDSVRSKSKCVETIADTAIGMTTEGKALLEGLEVFMVPASGDNHPLAVYGIDNSIMSENLSSEQSLDKARPVLLLHGRTWSSVPVYHLLGGPSRKEKGLESRSLMEALYENGLQPYAMDFRGFGGTPMDATKCVEPFRCVSDVETVLRWISQRHGGVEDTISINDAKASLDMPALLGWSQGALVAQMVAQKNHHLLSKLVLYGSIYDPLIRYVRDPLYTTSPASDECPIINTADAAMEDFTIEGTISQETAIAFAEAALISDPHKANWKHLYQFNTLDPARVHVPTLVVAGDQDPYAPLHIQADLFTNLGRGSDRTWSILADADHAAHMLDGRERFCNIVTSFVQNGKRSDKSHYL
jgi:pimeloyl-ACP methyl ester carboxylesterase